METAKNERKDTIEKGLRKYSPCNCAKTRKFVFGKEMKRLGERDRRRTPASDSHKLPSLGPGDPHSGFVRGSFSPPRSRTPYFKLKGRLRSPQSPEISLQRDASPLQDRTERSLTPEPWIYPAAGSVSSRSVSVPRPNPVSPIPIPALTSLLSTPSPAICTPTPRPQTIIKPSLESEANQSFETMMSFCDTVRESRKTPLMTRISGTEKLIRKYEDVRNFINYLPHAPGQHFNLDRVTAYLNRNKVIRRSEFIDKESAVTCADEKYSTTIFISKRFGKPKVWRHNGRIISLKAENGLISRWNLR